MTYRLRAWRVATTFLRPGRSSTWLWGAEYKTNTLSPRPSIAGKTNQITGALFAGKTNQINGTSFAGKTNQITFICRQNKPDYFNRVKGRFD